MIQGLLDGDRGKLRAWCIQKGPTGRRKPDSVYFLHTPAAQALVHGVVFAIDGQKRLALSASFRRDQFTGGDQAFLVRKTERLPCARSLVGRLKSGHADNGADHEINFGMGGDGDRAGRSIDHFDLAEASLLEAAA